MSEIKKLRDRAEKKRNEATNAARKDAQNRLIRLIETYGIDKTCAATGFNESTVLLYARSATPPRIDARKVDVAEQVLATEG
jgi:hypothetical protein